MTSGEPPTTCFVVMPITVPGHLLDRYAGRADHFVKIFDALIEPAVSEAGLTPIGPSRTGTENIHAAIINDLQGADLVLADLSALNPNVFLELGIRSALDKPVCLVWDGLDDLPFDSGTLNSHKYDPTPMYELNSEIAKMSSFIASTMHKSDGRNELWKFFGSASAILPVAELDPADASLHAKIDRLADLVERQHVSRTALRIPSPVEGPGVEPLNELWRRVVSAMLAAGPAGIHGSKIRAVCTEVLGAAYDDFLAGRPLNVRLTELGIPIRTNDSGAFFLGPS